MIYQGPLPFHNNALISSPLQIKKKKKKLSSYVFNGEIMDFLNMQELFF